MFIIKKAYDLEIQTLYYTKVAIIILYKYILYLIFFNTIQTAMNFILSYTSYFSIEFRRYYELWLYIVFYRSINL